MKNGVNGSNQGFISSSSLSLDNHSIPQIPGNNSIKAAKSPNANTGGQTGAKKQRKAKSRNSKHAVGQVNSTAGVISQRVRSEQHSALRN